MAHDHEDIDPTATTAPSGAGGSSNIGGGGRVDVDHVITPVEIGGAYEVVRLIGRGGMGVVYEARHARLGKRVALKVLRTADATAEQLQRFDREARALAALSHRNIAQVTDAGIHSVGVLAIPYCVMELLDGALPIVEHARRNELGLSQRVQLVIDACEALHHAHEAGIVHRDVKPSNLLVTPAGQVKVIDFGAAAMLPAADGVSVAVTLASEPGSLMGTLAYMSPEHFDGDVGGVDRRADVYALGVTLYELLCGSRPYELPGRDLAAAERIVRETEPTKPRKINPRISRSLEAVMLAALHKNPDRRYQTAAALAADLRNALDERPVSVAPESVVRGTATRLRRWVRRHPRWATAAIGGAVTILGVWIADAVDHAGASRWYERNALVWFDFVPDAPSDDIRMIVIDTKTDFEKLAAAAKLPETVDNNVRASWRAIHGRLLERLATARPKVVGVDIQFAKESEFDESLRRGLSRLRTEHIPTVLACGTFSGSPQEQTIPAVQELASALGYTTMQPSPAGPWTAHLALQRGASQPQITFALAAAACFWHGRAPSSLMLRIDHVHVRWPDGQQRPVRATVLEEQDEAHTNTGVQPGDILAQLELELPRNGSFDPSTVTLERALLASDRELQDMFGNKLVLIGDLRPGEDGPYEHLGGRRIHGVQAQHQAIRQLIEGRSPKRLPLYEVAFIGLDGRFAVILAAILVGTIVGIVAIRQCVMMGVVLVVIVLVLTGVAVISAYQLGAWLVSPIPPMLVTLSASAGIYAANRFVRRLALKPGG